METAFQGLNDAPSDGVKSAERVLSVLELLGGIDRPVSLAELSLDLAIPKSSALALLRTLQRRGYVVRDEAERYLIAPPFRGHDADWVGGIPGRLLRAARPVVQDLLARTRETINLGVLLPGGTVRAVLQCPSPQEVRYVPADTECPAYCTAMGRMLLAHLPAPEVADILDRGRLAKLTDKTETRPAAVKKLVAQARQQGFAEIDGEYAEGGSGAAAPIVDHTGTVIAVLNLATLSMRWRRQKDEFIPELVRAAARISGELAKLAPPRAA